jgi:hypothetical protein
MSDVMRNAVNHSVAIIFAELVNLHAWFNFGCTSL